MKKKNVDIREMAKLKGVYLWQIADKLEMDNGNFSKKLRKELSENEKRKIYDLIEIISKENTAH